MLGVIIVHDEAGVDHAGDPAQQGQEKAQDETEDPASHQNRDRRQHDTEKITERFHDSDKFFGDNPPMAAEGNQSLLITLPRKIGIRLVALIRFLSTMKKNLIALTLLGLVGIFLAGCAATTETTTTTTRTREESSMYAR